MRDGLFPIANQAPKNVIHTILAFDISLTE